MRTRLADSVAAAHGGVAISAERAAADKRGIGHQSAAPGEQNAEVERKNTEVEQARGALEEKAAELALTSKYKSNFSQHVARTAHAAQFILILSQQLAENAAGSLSRGNRVLAQHQLLGSDLLHLINDILDLSKSSPAQSRWKSRE